MSDISADTMVCLTAITANPQDAQAWQDGLRAAIKNQQGGEFLTLLNFMYSKNINRIDHIITLAGWLGDEKNNPEYFSYLQYLLKETVFITPVFCVMGIMSYIYYSDLESAKDYLEQAVRIGLAKNHPNLSKDENISIRNYIGNYGLTYLNFISLIKPEWTEDKTSGIYLPDIPASELVVLAACDEGYYQKYGEHFIRSLTSILPNAVAFIHVMNPTEEGEHQRESLQMEVKSCGFSSETVPSTPAYYAARRFMIANDLRQTYRRDVLVLDVDENLNEGFTNIVAQIRKFPLALWQNISPDKSFSGIVEGPLFKTMQGGISEGIVFLSASSPIPDRFFSVVKSYFQERLEKNIEFWGWDSHGLRHGLCGLSLSDRDEVLNLATVCPDLLDETMKMDDGKSRQPVKNDRNRLEMLKILEKIFNPQKNPFPFQWFSSVTVKNP